MIYLLLLIIAEIMLFIFAWSSKSITPMEALIRSNMVFIVFFAGKLMMFDGLITNIGTVFYATVMAGQIFILEKYGFERAKTTINSIIFVLSIAFTLGYIVYLFPILPHNEIAKSINNVIFSSWRIIWSAYLAFYIAQSLFLIVWKRLESQWFYIRNIAGIITIQFIDSVLFFTVAFGYSTKLFALICLGFLVKIAIGFIFLPIIRIMKVRNPQYNIDIG